ncbi:undecaprenyl-diphosphatase UppP [Anaerobacillus alkaliphilus]|uniref:Undecaprenyl-diphosphatase n=1 Tax=Anaerobacillus alkaliphilus TaxID=1548597 RepID=A0A4Q0VXE2_9BACI|nr:undecaprenyl-diphosphatase UppP [Anaerobacillus alkaliphilus]RXJ03826.1 undecaprenyl-diphosphatase UppP [Anaerobacillus alkaliphilus]
MSILEAILFGIVQGLTEFLPISSTAHIVITQLILGTPFPGLAFEIYLHIASILAVVIYFRKDLLAVIVGFFRYFKTKSAENRVHFLFALYIIVATFITGGLGILLKDYIGDNMKSPTFISVTLVVTGLGLVFIERFHRYGNRTEKEMTFLDSIIVGLAQTLSVLPGISRSGATLIAALVIGLNRETAVRYSFLLVIPVILGSTVLAVGDVSRDIFAAIGTPALVVSFITTFVFSWLGIIWLIDFLKRSKLIYFAIYCFVVAILVFLFIDPTTVIDI